jgi:hypothetical protein
MKFRDVGADGACARDAVADAQEVGHAEGEAAQLRQQGAHGRVGDALHRRQHHGGQVGPDDRDMHHFFPPPRLADHQADSTA